MRILNFRPPAAFLTLAMLTVAASAPITVRAEVPSVDPAATKILERMTAYLGDLEEFSVNTQNTIEDLLDGHRVDLDVSASVTVKRPNKLRAERKGDRIDQIFYYNGKTLTLYNPANKVYATEPAPKTIEGVLDFARESLGLIIPASDLVYRNAYPLLMHDVSFAVVVDKAFINGVQCDHLLFSRPGVDFQVWVADSGKPLPHKYVVTDTSTPARVSVSTVMSDWNVAPNVPDTTFAFKAPPGIQQIPFMSPQTSGGSSR